VAERTVYKYCPHTETVVVMDTCEACEAPKAKRANFVVSVPFQPQHFYAVGSYCSTKRELQEKTARMGRTLVKG
jgi:hypothetical protein